MIKNFVIDTIGETIVKSLKHTVIVQHENRTELQKFKKF